MELNMQLLGPASGDEFAHKYKSPSGAREPDTAHPATTAVATGARAERPMWVRGKAWKWPCAATTFAKSATFFQALNCSEGTAL